MVKRKSVSLLFCHTS